MSVCICNAIAHPPCSHCTEPPTVQQALKEFLSKGIHLQVFFGPHSISNKTIEIREVVDDVCVVSRWYNDKRGSIYENSDLDYYLSLLERGRLRDLDGNVLEYRDGNICNKEYRVQESLEEANQKPSLPEDEA